MITKLGSDLYFFSFKDSIHRLLQFKKGKNNAFLTYFVEKIKNKYMGPIILMKIFCLKVSLGDKIE